MKQHIKEIIVVEGKNDTNTLQSFFDCDTIETGGDQVNEKTIAVSYTHLTLPTNSLV